MVSKEISRETLTKWLPGNSKEDDKHCMLLETSVSVMKPLSEATIVRSNILDFNEDLIFIFASKGGRPGEVPS